MLIKLILKQINISNNSYCHRHSMFCWFLTILNIFTVRNTSIYKALKCNLVHNFRNNNLKSLFCECYVIEYMAPWKIRFGGHIKQDLHSWSQLILMYNQRTFPALVADFTDSIKRCPYKCLWQPELTFLPRT